MLNEKDYISKAKVANISIGFVNYYRMIIILISILISILMLYYHFKIQSLQHHVLLVMMVLGIEYCLYKIPYWWIMLKFNSKKAQVYYDFPLWVSSLEVLIASNTIVNTLKASLETCPKSFVGDLKQLLIHLEKEPTNKKHYLSFLNQYNLPEVKDMMLDFYQFNFLNKDLMIREFKNLNIRLNKMERTSRKHKQMQQIFLIGALNSIPLFLLSCYILLIANMLSSSLMGSL